MNIKNFSQIQSQRISALIMWWLAIGTFYSPFIFPALLLICSIYLTKSKAHMLSEIELSPVPVDLEQDY